MLPKDDSFKWEAVMLMVARMKVRSDRRLRSFWNLPKMRRTACEADEWFEITTICPSINVGNDHKASPSQLRGATEIVVKRDDCSLRMWRHNSDAFWTLEGGGALRSIFKTYRISAGATALALTLDAWRSRSAPPEPVGVDGDVEVADFMAFVQDLSIRARQLDFAALALGMTDEPPPVPPAAPAKDAVAVTP